MVNKVIQLIVIVVGIPIGMFLSNRSQLMHEALEHPLAVQHTNMEHGLIDVSQESPIPQITDLIVHQDKMSGLNIRIETAHFIFTPENVNGPHRAGQGHAHLYINGEKFARLYGPNFHLPKIAAPIEDIRVTLNANGHETMAIHEQVIDRIWKP